MGFLAVGRNLITKTIQGQPSGNGQIEVGESPRADDLIGLEQARSRALCRFRLTDLHISADKSACSQKTGAN